MDGVNSLPLADPASAALRRVYRRLYLLGVEVEQMDDHDCGAGDPDDRPRPAEHDQADEHDHGEER